MFGMGDRVFGLVCEEELLVWFERKSSWFGIREKFLGLVWEKEFLVWCERKSS